MTRTEDFSRSRRLICARERVDVGEFLLLQNRSQVVQDLIIALLHGVLGGDSDGGKRIIGRCGEMHRLTLLDVLWQFVAAARFHLLHHIRAKLGNQAEDVFGGKRFKTLPIQGMADRHSKDRKTP